MFSLAKLPEKIVGVIFDCDGVIIDSRKPNSVYYNKILEAFDLPPLTKAQEDYTYMATVEQALRSIIPTHLHSQIAEVAKKSVDYARDIMPLVELEVGFTDFIDFLKEKNVRLAIHTNRAEGMRIVTNKFPLLKEFSPIMTADIVRPKPDPEGIFHILEAWGVGAQDVIFVGDSDNDRAAAQAAQVAFVAYGNENVQSNIFAKSYGALQETIAKFV